MSTTVEQDRNFRDAVVSTDLLEESIDWIQRNLEPGDVFATEELKTWAEGNGFVEED